MATRVRPILRLMAIDEAAGDWQGVAKKARRLLAVNPLIPAPHRALARACRATGGTNDAVTAYRALAIIDDTDPAELHYRLGRLLHQTGKPAEARRRSSQVSGRSTAVSRRASALARTGRPCLTHDAFFTHTPFWGEAMTPRRLILLALPIVMAIAVGIAGPVVPAVPAAGTLSPDGNPPRGSSRRA